MNSKLSMFVATHLAVCNLYKFIEFIFNTWVYLNRKIVYFCHANAVNADYEYVFRNVRKLEKIPAHITVLLGNEKPSYKDLANLVVWSIASGISFISFYDHEGNLNRTEADFQEAVNKRKMKDTHIIWCNGENSYKNGIIGKKIRVRTLSPSNGRQSVIDVAKQFCRSEDNEIDPQAVDGNLKDTYVFPDPELGLYCGKVFSVYGYPPWQMRTTEFLELGTHHDITPYTFIKALYVYSKTEQRLGK